MEAEANGGSLILRKRDDGDWRADFSGLEQKDPSDVST
jgi:hypothetical protein